MTYRVIQWSTGNVGQHALRLHHRPSRARARRALGAQRRQGRPRRRRARRPRPDRRHRDERRRRAARARRRLRLLHRDRRPAARPRRSTTCAASSRRARTSCRARSCRSCYPPHVDAERCASRSRTACDAGRHVVLHVGHRPRVRQRPAAARAHRARASASTRSACMEIVNYATYDAARGALRDDGLRPSRSTRTPLLLIPGVLVVRLGRHGQGDRRRARRRARGDPRGARAAAGDRDDRPRLRRRRAGHDGGAALRGAGHRRRRAAIVARARHPARRRPRARLAAAGRAQRLPRHRRGHPELHLRRRR